MHEPEILGRFNVALAHCTVELSHTTRAILRQSCAPPPLRCIHIYPPTQTQTHGAHVDGSGDTRSFTWDSDNCEQTAIHSKRIVPQGTVKRENPKPQTPTLNSEQCAGHPCSSTHMHTCACSHTRTRTRHTSYKTSPPTSTLHTSHK